jgi:hypothetical protein
MADKGAKKKAKPKRQKAAAQPGVLGSLPGQRPQRLGGRARPARPPAAEPAAPARAGRPRAAAREAPARRPAADEAPGRRPAAVSPASPRLEPRARPTPPPPEPARRHISPPRGTELVSTAIQAAGELAQIGLTMGGQAIKRAVDRIPKP